jgi:hypothetical protein
MRVLAMADIHGSHDLYEYVPRLADEHPTYFQTALLRMPNRPRLVFGLARAARALGDNETGETVRRVPNDLETG